MTKVLAPLAGQFHKPGARVLLEHLPVGTPLALVPEEDNPYDDKAIKVLLTADAINASPAVDKLDDALIVQGYTLEQVLSECPFCIGYVAASGGKPLAKAREAMPSLGLVGNAEFHDGMDEGHRAYLEFALNGQPLVALVYGEGELDGVLADGPEADLTPADDEMIEGDEADQLAEEDQEVVRGDDEDLAEGEGK